MAKLKYSLNYYQELDQFLGVFSPLTVTGGGKRATLANEAGSEVKFVGKGLSSDGDHGFDGGKVTAISFVNPDDHTVVDITGLNINASKLTAGFDLEGVLSVLKAATNGDDTVIGTNNADYLVSGGGDDMLTGKGEADTFVFQANPTFRSNAKVPAEHDVIADFDAKGDDADMLIFGKTYLGFKSVHGGDDVELKFVGGSTLLLEDVTKKEFQYWLDHQA